MLANHFDFTHKGKKKADKIVEDIFTFKCGFNISYIVEVENHNLNIYIVKFFQKNHRHSDSRYSLVNSKKFLKRHGSSGVKNFLKILNTILCIVVEIYKRDNKAAFGFMGAPTSLELDPVKSFKKINEDGTVAKTKRFNTYSIYVKRYFAPDKFEHIEIESSSCYMLKSVYNETLTTNKIESFFENYIFEGYY